MRFVVVWLVFQSLGLCSSLNDEGKALLKLRQRIVRDPFGGLNCQNWIDNEGEQRLTCVIGLELSAWMEERWCFKW
ncbi:putative inactive receptor-like protein kinase [Senna tora]|uniref:Putative inactive receptor-like protein kinase n=1 Tax=Senna tora TaxID=362788 RepID=A0A834T0T8_9FABA|nr:putative inactive receptor-like protein kinase [Senna tora]